MKTIENVTIGEIQQQLEVVEIQLKLLFKSYQDFVGDFLTWRIDDPKEHDKATKQKLLEDFKIILRTLQVYADQIGSNVDLVDKLTAKVSSTKSISMIKSLEHNLYKLDKVLLKCNTYIFIIDESQVSIATVLDYKKEKKRVLN